MSWIKILPLLEWDSMERGVSSGILSSSPDVVQNYEVLFFAPLAENSVSLDAMHTSILKTVLFTNDYRFIQVTDFRSTIIWNLLHVFQHPRIKSIWHRRCNGLGRHHVEQNPEGPELANMVTKVTKLTANWVAKYDANLVLSPRSRQVPIESPL
ncbi:hypothetical protein TNCV_3085721 [Trichonephila clavipes]|nr:hypothetical protein TNCV_3085721 [Trichonephila clavipes]